MQWLFSGAFEADGRLEMMGASWQWQAALGLALVTLALAWMGGPRRRRWLEMVLLGLAGAAFVLAALQPTWVVEGKRQEKARSAVLVDVSRSMKVLDGGEPRSTQVEAILDAIDPDEQTEIFLFGDSLRPGQPERFEDATTDLAEALAAVTDRFAGERLASISLVSDGIDRSWLRRRFNDESELAAPELPGPLTVYQVGSGEALVDLSVAELDTAGFAFLRTPFEIEARIESSGLEQTRVPVSLSVDGKALREKQVLLDEDGRGSVTFTITPSRVGRFTYTLSVPVLEGDSLPGNNSLPAVVRVVRDRMRVLQVCGAPSFDEKFLRLLLKQDPSVDLVSFFILRTYEDGLGSYRDSELSLIEFPYRNLFTTDLWSFDLIVLQNFDHLPYFRWESNALLKNIADYVKRGGALVMIGGDRSFDLGEYAGTPLEEVLPVRLGVKGKSVDEASFQPRLTAQGQRHPITQLLSSPLENQALWSRLSALDGMNLNTGLASGSAALLVHPTQQVGGRAMPVLAVREVGEGRSMAFMGDSSWRWVMAEAALGHGNQAYLRFWKNAMRWLVRDPIGQPVQVNTGRENYLIGDEVRLRVQVRDVGFEPVEAAEVQVEIQGPDGLQELSGQTTPEGELLLPVPATTRGAFRIHAKAVKSGVTLGEAQSVFAITDRDPELDDVIPDGRFLEALAQSYEGRFYAHDAAGKPLRDADAGRWVDEREEHPLWAGAWLPIWAAVFLSLSWWIRRKDGGR